MRFDDRPADGQSHAGTLTFGGEECIADFRRPFRLQSDPGITDRDHHLGCIASLLPPSEALVAWQAHTRTVHNPETSRAWKSAIFVLYLDLFAKALRGTQLLWDVRFSLYWLLHRHFIPAPNFCTPYPQFSHFMDQRSALQAEFDGCAIRAADHPSDSFKRPPDKNAL